MNNKKQIQAIAIILVAVIALSIGFAAFSATLNIESEASVNPNASDFSVKFSKQQNTLDESDVNATSIIGVNAEALVAKISNANSPTITGLNASFTTPGSSVTYEFYVMNTGSYNAYLRNVNFSASVNGVDFISCKAGTGATPSLVNEACQGINFELTIGDEVYTPQDTEVNQELLKGTSKKVTVKISYETGSALADGPFTVDIGDVKLTYASTSTGDYPIPEESEEDEIVATDAACFISTTAGEINDYVCDDTDIVIPANLALPVSDPTSAIFNMDKCVNFMMAEGVEEENEALSECASMESEFSDLSIEEIKSDFYAWFADFTYETSATDTILITSIGDYSFDGMYLNSVDISNNIIKIGIAAFSMNNLKSVIIPDPVISIGENAFVYNPLEVVEIGSGITYLDRVDFGYSSYNSSTLTSVIINNSKSNVKIGDDVFNFVNGEDNIRWLKDEQ